MDVLNDRVDSETDSDTSLEEAPVRMDIVKAKKNNKLDMSTKHIDKYKALLEKNLKNDENLQEYGLEYYMLLKDIYNKYDLELLGKLMNHKTNDIIAEMAYYYWLNKSSKLASTYFMELAHNGCSKYCDLIPKMKINNDFKETYYETLFSKDKCQTVFEAYVKYLISKKDLITAHTIYIEANTENTIKPIDLSSYDYQLINHVVYGKNNIFPTDPITNIYINKLNNKSFNKKGKCSVCLEDDVNMIPFDCTHFVCSHKCYPRIMIDAQQCPECRINYNYKYEIWEH